METAETDKKIALLKERIELARHHLYYLLDDLAKVSPAEWEFSHRNPPGQRNVEVYCYIAQGRIKPAE